jgi:hypothetical protein
MARKSNYVEAGWWNDLEEARWTVVMLGFEFAALLGAFLSFVYARRLGHLHGGIRTSSSVDGATAFGGLLSLVCVVAGIAAAAYSWQLALLSSHRVRRLAQFGVGLAVIGVALLIVLGAIAM